jgi:energy-coupling factor transporter ATP-binding protein EcfA2
MLSLESVTYRYAGAARPSLHEVSVEFGDGEVVGITGRSEAGKTTLCLVASGLAPRTVGGEMTGRLLLDGEDAAPMAIHQLSGRIGIAFASPATQLSGVAGTVYEEVAFGPMNLGLPRSEIIDRTGQALATLGIEQLAARDPAHLSGGQQQLVAIAGLLALRPAHLVLDEPTAQLDPAGTQLVGDRLAQLAGAGVSIVITEQKTDLLAAICQRVVVLDAGRVILDGPTGTVLANPMLDAVSVAPPGSVRLERAALAADVPDASRARLHEALSA